MTRVWTAAVLAPTAVVAIVFGTPVFEAMVAAGTVVMAWEWCRLCGGDGFSSGFFVLAVALPAAIATTVIGSPSAALAIVATAAVGVLLISDRKGWMVGGALYLGVPAVALVWLRADPVNGLALVVWLFVTVWASDVGAFVCGRLLGGPKLAPRVSPNKTWTGAGGGLVFASAVGGGALLAFGLLPGGGGGTFAASAGIGVAAQAGDLFESWIKRRFGVKDTSSLVPGHGGLLDRVDSLLSATLVVVPFSIFVGMR